MKQDRFLIGILIAIAALVILALGLFYLRRGEQDYISGDTPEGVLRNYILAIQKKDYSRAYDYLDDFSDKPSLASFQNHFLSEAQVIDSVAIQLGEIDQTGDQAVVSLRLIHSGSGPFDTGWREATTALLIKDATGAWKITRIPYPYWNYSWNPPKL